MPDLISIETALARAYRDAHHQLEVLRRAPTPTTTDAQARRDETEAALNAALLLARIGILNSQLLRTDP